MALAEVEWRKLMSKAYKLMGGTWGYCHLGFETCQLKNEFNHPAPPGPNYFNGMSQGQVVASLFNPDWGSELRGYVCFQDELDALQFRLTLDAKAIKVDMWPSDRKFLIHEIMNGS